ncbi:MAG: hypothetical protein RBR97_15715 [Bacteroidales bacterium]|jgi:hypothetical protein|nr:hypothetical protein [Bacteroidales bacterium]
MEENIKSDVLQSMGIVFEKSKNCNPMKMLEFGGHFETLYARGILQQQGAYPTADLPSSCESIMFNNMVVQAVVNNKPIPEAPQHEQDNLVGLLEKFYLPGLQHSEKEISTCFLFQKAQDLLRFNMGSASERRLLFKIEFKNPSHPLRLLGRPINNIVRKVRNTVQLVTLKR